MVPPNPSILRAHFPIKPTHRCYRSVSFVSAQIGTRSLILNPLSARVEEPPTISIPTQAFVAHP